MRKITIIGSLAALLAGLTLVSCSFGLQPSWKNADTSTRVAMQFAIPRAVGSRAIAPGNGYLYIRTFGGPTGEKGPSYGPYFLGKDSSSFITTDIPAGEYSKFGIILSLVPLENKTYTNPLSGSTISFKDMMSSSDADFEAYSDGENSPFDSIVAGISTGIILENVNILEGKITTITATLTPMVNGLISATGGTGSTYMLPITSERTGRYFAIDNLNPNTVTLNELRASATPLGTAAVYTIAFYDSQGKQKAIIYPTANISDIQTFTLPFSGNADGYMYIEYSGNIQWTFVPFNNTGAQNNLTVNFSYDTAFGAIVENKKIFVGVYDAAALTDDGPPSEAPLGVGLTTLTNTGNASIQINSPGTNTAANFTTIGQSLVVMAFIDMNNRYAFTDTASLTDAEIGTIQPQYGDYSTDKGTAYTILEGENSYPLDTNDMLFNTNYTIYVSQSGTGDGTGTSANNSTTLINALSLGIPSDANNISLSLIENITLTASVSFDGPYHISSNSQTPFTISDGRGATANSTSLIMVTNTTQLPDTYLHLENVIIDGLNRTANQAPGIEVTQNAHLDLAEGAVVQNFINYSTSNFGGGILVNSGSLRIDGGTIANNSAESGGGVYAGLFENGGHIEFNSGSIHGNTATLNGGGIYLGYMASLTMSPGDPLPVIMDNSASEGAGLYIFDYARLDHAGVDYLTQIINNTGPNVYISPMGIISSAIVKVYVTEDGSGNGLSSSDPASFSTVISGLSNTPYDSVQSIALMSDVTLTETMMIPPGRNIHIYSESSTNYRIAPAGTIAGPLISVIGGNPYTTLSMNRVTIGPEVPGITTYNLISAGTQSQVYLQDGTILENNNSSQDGSGVSLTGGSLTLTGGIIRNCTTTGNGGGVFVSSGSILTLSSSSITQNQASLGGGVYFETYQYSLDTQFYEQVTGNTATSNATYNDIYNLMI